jgi:hypothetical protein
MSSWDQDSPKTAKAAPWRKASRFPLILWGLFVAGLFLFARSNQRTYEEGRASERWPEVVGLVDSFSLVPDDMGKLQPNLLYRYEVGGTAYQGTRLHAVDHQLRASEATWLEQRLVVGAKVAVRYDPSDPARAALTVGSGADELEGLLAGWFGVLFVAIFGFGLYANLRRGRVLSIGDALASQRRTIGAVS